MVSRILLILMIDISYVAHMQSYPELDLDDIMVIDEGERETRLKVNQTISRVFEMTFRQN